MLTFSSPTAYGQIAVAKLSASFLICDLPTNRLALATNNNLRGKTMQKIHITLLIIFSSAFFSAGAIAQNQPLACQVEASAGLSWDNGRWVTSTFRTGRFVLVQTKDGLTIESVAKVFGNNFSVICEKVLPLTPKISCTDQIGNHLYFDPNNLAGGTSYLFGATGGEAKADTPYVSVFSCTPF